MTRRQFIAQWRLRHILNLTAIERAALIVLLHYVAQ